MLKQILSFLSGGLVGGIVGGFFSFFWQKWLPDRLTWRRQQRIEREKLMAQFSGPAVRAFHDLANRIYGTVRADALGYDEVKQDGHQDYYIEATTFQIAQCCAWLEILRNTMGALDYAQLVNKLDQVSSSLASRFPGFRVFQLEQRDIAERMARMIDGQINCCGYSEFLDALKAEKPTPFKILHQRVERMLEHWPEEVIKLIRVQHALLDAIEFIDPKFRWVRADQRIKLETEKVINRLVTEKFLSVDKAAELRQQALNYRTAVSSNSLPDANRSTLS